MQIQFSWLLQFFRSQLIWIYTVCKGSVYPGFSRTRVKKINVIHFQARQLCQTCYCPLLKKVHSKKERIYSEANSFLLEKTHFQKWLTKDVSLVKMAENLTLVLLNLDTPCLSKQCRSRPVGFWRSHQIWICTVCHKVCEFIASIWIKQSDWLKIKCGCDILIYSAC